MATVVWLPKDAYKAKLKAWVGNHRFELKMDHDMIKKAREDYLLLDPYDDAFEQYVLSSLFKEFLEQGGDVSDWEAWLDFREEHTGKLHNE